MTGGYVFLNALGFWAMKISFGGLTGTVLYIGYSALIGFLVFLLSGKFRPCMRDRDANATAGTIGFAASFLFARRIYSSIKID